ncbi:MULTISPECIES: YolD-like family protein [Bacillus cereus group]|uniref:YolD-like family protein n=1 Tax=Bacillus cereus group TaxID=86661 RepID=UPI000A3AA6C7|nr:MULTISPECIES: YolD-like family protein [Bacillus cereus group]MBJ8023178.1 YolD-like family protein [Bacillus cereus]MBJ8037492.1 YolD-like family protein [Bacillus cereus]MEC3597746.1 YolD-like family protein [Bacillus thuringiensis]MED2034389.1 YolD-like family protein [Bacillus thuringiensis]MED2209933.1 YolD-like family protein [Bacillus thuringiensis]
MSTSIPKPPKKKATKKEPRPYMDEFEQQEAAELIQLAVQDDTELVFTVYRKYKEPDVIQGKIIKLEQQLNRIVVSDGPNAIHKIQFMDILKIETPS